LFKSILVAWDGSEHAKRALAEAVDLARTQDARLTLLTVAAPLYAWPGYVPRVSEADLVGAAEQILAEGEALVPEGIPVSGRTATGGQGPELLKRTASADHDLIVMLPRARGDPLGRPRLRFALRAQPRDGSRPHRPRRREGARGPYGSS
jgi:nucleotide-binding universal stress UspA family protein